jgi:hypothetical protein
MADSSAALSGRACSVRGIWVLGGDGTVLLSRYAPLPPALPSVLKAQKENSVVKAGSDLALRVSACAGASPRLSADGSERWLRLDSWRPHRSKQQLRLPTLLAPATPSSPWCPSTP